MPRVYISIGSNIDRAAKIRAAVAALRERYGELTLSSVYESSAVGFEGDDFYNLVAAFDSGEGVTSINAFLHELERANGRSRASSPFTPRTLDLDLLLYGQTVMDDGRVRIPRDEITRYAFVLAPLAEIAGGELHPVSGESFENMWRDFSDSSQQLRRVDFTWQVNR